MHLRTMRVVLRLAVSLIFVQIIAGANASKRNLADYDVFGPYTVPLAINEQNKNISSKICADLRNFIWNHWNEHKRGYAVVTEVSLEESVPCTTTYYIEPDKDGNWHIEERWKCKKGRPRTGMSIITSVQRLATDSNGFKTDVILPDGADVQPELYILAFRGVSGQSEGYR